MASMSRPAAVVVGILIVAGVYLMNRSQDGEIGDPAGPGAARNPGLSGEAAPPRGDAGEDPAEEAIRGRTKSKERPAPREIAKARLERAHEETRWQLESARASGLGHAHPVVRSLSARIEAIESDLEAAR